MSRAETEGHGRRAERERPAAGSQVGHRWSYWSYLSQPSLLMGSGAIARLHLLQVVIHIDNCKSCHITIDNGKSCHITGVWQVHGRQGSMAFLQNQFRFPPMLGARRT